MPSNQSWKRYMYPNVHCNTIYNSYNRKQSRCPLTDEWIKNLWYICESESSSFVSDSLQPHGLSLSHKKECIWVSSDEVDEPRTYYTEWNESERERQILYSNTNIRNLEKWYWRIYLQGSNGETGIENRLMDMGKGEERMRSMERVTWKLTLPSVK